MVRIHFLNVLEGDCNIIQHDSNRITVMDVSNAYNDEDTPEEKAVKTSQKERKCDDGPTFRQIRWITGKS